MQNKYRGVILGASGRGAYGHDLDLAFSRVPSVDVVGISDTDPEELKKAVSRSKAQRSYADYRSMLAQEKPDIAVVAPRWCDQRKPMVLACVEAGVRAIYLEKPIAASLQDADAMLDACASAGIQTAVDHWRASGEVRKAMELIESGAIGQVQIIRGHGKADRRAGGVDLMILGTHILDAMRYLADSEVVWTQGYVAKDRNEVSRSDAFPGPEEIGLTAGTALTGQYLFANGVIGYYESLPSSQEEDQKLPSGINYIGLEVHGTRGILCLRQRRLDLYPRGLWMPGDEYGQWKKIPLSGWEDFDGQSYYQHCHEVCVNGLIEGLENRPRPKSVSTLQDGRAAIEMIMALHESHLEGRRISSPMQKRTNPYDGGP